MQREIAITREVEEVLGANLQPVLLRARNQEQMACDVCKEAIGPQARTALLLYRDSANARLLVRFAHEACKPPGVVETSLPADFALATRWRAYLTSTAAFLLWEPMAVLDLVDGGDPIAAGLLALGFRPVDQLIHRLAPVRISDAAMVVERHRIRLMRGSEPAADFGDLADRDPECLWRSKLGEFRNCTLIYGHRLGLDAPTKRVLDERFRTDPRPLHGTVPVSVT